MLGVHASGVCTGISARQEHIGRDDVADGRRFRGKKLTTVVYRFKNTGGSRDTHTGTSTLKTRCPGHAGPGTNPGRRTEEAAPSEPHWRTHITNPTTFNSLPPPPALRRAPPVRAPPASAREVIRVGQFGVGEIGFLIRIVFYNFRRPDTHCR